MAGVSCSPSLPLGSVAFRTPSVLGGRKATSLVQGLRTATPIASFLTERGTKSSGVWGGGGWEGEGTRAWAAVSRWHPRFTGSFWSQM